MVDGDPIENYTPPQSPLAPEGESKPSGFRVRVDNSDLIFKAVERGVSGELGNHLLESPINKVKVKLQVGKDTFNLVGDVDLALEATHDLSNLGRRLDQEKIRKSIAQKYGGFTERGGNFIITAPRGTKLVLSRDHMMSSLVVTTGMVEDIITRNIIQLAPSPQSDRESFDRAMADFIDVFQSAVGESYKQWGTLQPDEEMVLNSPKQEIGGRPGNGTKTPEDLLGKLEIERPDVSFEDIGGQANAKREVEGLAFALKNPELYKKWGTKPPKGIILYGPPGTGKTLMAKALASQADARFFHVEASDIASKWYGESETIVKSIFDLANQQEGKTIIFFDEIDAVAPQREGSHEATHRVISTLLENMDGLASNDNVMVVASTNRLDSIEPALIRAGRFDRWVEVPLPDESGRNQILGIHMAKAEQTAGRKLFGDVNIEAVIAKTEKASGADIAEITRRVLEEKVRQEGTSGQEPSLVVTEDILKELEGYERTRQVKKKIGFAPPEMRSQRDLS